MTDTTAIATQARVLEGRRVTVYTRHPETGVHEITQGVLGHVVEDLHLILRMDDVMPGESLTRIILPMILGLHATPDTAVPARDVTAGRVLDDGPLAGEVLEADAPEEFAGLVIRVRLRQAQGADVDLYSRPTARLPVASED